MNGFARLSPWGSKRQRTLSVSDDAWELLGELASPFRGNRSEVLEVVLRHLAENPVDLSKTRDRLLS
jgi:hypothetical protein